MRNKLTCSTFLMFALLLLAMPAMADTLTLSGPWGYSYGGVIVGPVTGNINGGAPLGLVCDDYVDTTYIGSSFSVNVSTIPSLQYAMYNTNRPGTPSAGQLAAYKRAALLVWQMSQPGNQNNNEMGGLNYALWHNFNPAVPLLGTAPSWLSWAQNQNLDNWSYDGVRVYTPDRTRDQEFMSGAATAVPEPASLMMLGTGLIFVGTFGARRLRRRAEEVIKS